MTDFYMQRVKMVRRIAVLATTFCLGVVSGQSRADVPSWNMGSPAKCQRLSSTRVHGVEISAARWEKGGPIPLPFPAMMPMLAHDQLPAHCLVRGVLDPRVGVGGVKYGLGFELRMPHDWNGRFLFQGGGGLDGTVMPAIGLVGVSGPVALARGFAVISSDGGHETSGPSAADFAAFAADQQARLDFAYAGLGPVAELGQRLVARYYGRPARDSYFAGCSNGGREAMMVVERFPTLFNGIIAGDPGFNMTKAGVAEMWSLKHLEQIAPKDSAGRPILSEALTDSDLRLVSAGVLQACDALDGLRDGMINDIAACRFDPRVLLCRPGSNRGCLSKPKVEALEAIFAGPQDSAGRPLDASWPFDAGIDALGWRIWKLGISTTSVPNAADATLGLAAMRYYFMMPPDPQMTPQTFNFDRALDLTARTAALEDATGTFFSTYIARGGKLIIYQGMSDPVFSPNAIIGWYRKLIAQYQEPQKWARLFLIPGMNHCFGGPATDQFDALSAIVQWTEDHKPPTRLIARGATFPGATRPLCPYPEYARYQGGDPNAEQSFVCATKP